MTGLPNYGPIGELDVTEWVGEPPGSLADLRGRVVAIEAFQMLCPGCVQHGLPQAQRLHRLFRREDVVVIGLHTVFEHHDVMAELDQSVARVGADEACSSGDQDPHPAVLLLAYSSR